MDLPAGSMGAWLLAAPRPLAFVLSGGGPMGAVQVGMLRALEEASIGPDLVVGASVGALNGSVVALEPTSASDRLADIWEGLDVDSVFGQSRRGTRGLSMMTQLIRSRTSIFSDEQLVSLIERHAPANTFTELSLPLTVMVTDRLTGEPLAISSGRLGRALAASAAIPGVLPPVEIDGRSYVDGGVVDTFPTRQARAEGAETIVLLEATPTDPRPDPPHGLVEGLIHSLSLTTRAQRRIAADPSIVGCPVIALPSATAPDATSFDFSKTTQLINDGYHRTIGFLSRPIDDVLGQTANP